MANFLGGLLSAASTVVPFIPGIGPGVKAGLMGLNALTGGANAARKSDRANNQLERGYGSMIQGGQDLTKLSMDQLAPMLRQYTDMVGNGGIPNFDARYRGYMSGNAPGYDNAVASTMMDFGDRGFTPGSSPVAGAVSNIRAKESQSGLDFRQGLMAEAMNNKQQMLQNGVPMLSGLMGQGNSMTGAGLSGMGGVGGLYASQSNGFSDALGSLGQFLPGLLGNNKDPNAGNNTLGTNQVVRQNGVAMPNPNGNVGQLAQAEDDPYQAPMMQPMARQTGGRLGSNIRLPKWRL